MLKMKCPFMVVDTKKTTAKKELTSIATLSLSTHQLPTPNKFKLLKLN